MPKQYHDYTYKKLKEFLNALTIDCNGDYPNIYWRTRDYDNETVLVCTDSKNDNTIREFYGITQKSINTMIAVAKKGAL